ncbi:MAG: hypothetical protein JSS02_27975, partial [Planctomycetes bacterium]|nr:hypothetical protein [Planctomycetota bacterium]
MLRATDKFVLMPSVGPLIAGQAIVVSRAHHHSLAAMDEAAAREYDDFVRKILGTDGNWLEAEHGATDADCAGACVIHTHVHVIPGMAHFEELFDG